MADGRLSVMKAIVWMRELLRSGGSASAGRHQAGKDQALVGGVGNCEGAASRASVRDILRPKVLRAHDGGEEKEDGQNLATLTAKGEEEGAFWGSCLFVGGDGDLRGD